VRCSSPGGATAARGLVANTYLKGSYSERYPGITPDEAGMRMLFRQFSFPGGIPSHVAPETPGSIHEGGELGYALVHAYGAAFDNPGLLVCCVVGDGEAETGPLAASWHSNKFLNPANDLPPARRQLPAVGRRSLPAQPPLRERHRRRQAAGAQLPADGRGCRALHQRHRHVVMGRQRRRRRARRRHGLRRRRSHARDARRGGAPARARPRAARPRRQRHRPHAPAARERAPPRPSPMPSSTRCSPPTGP
jgi:hypothetical protein